MPKRQSTKKQQSALFPSGNIDPETKAAFDRMMAAHGDELNKPSTQRHVHTTAKQAVVTDPFARQPQISEAPIQVPEQVSRQVNATRRGKMNAFVSAMNNQLASAVYTVKLSDGRELNFEAPRMKTQKTLNQIIASNKDDPGAQYIAQIALIKSVCLTPGIDFWTISDFDRNKILFTLYRDVLFRGEYKYKCDQPDCKHEWVGKLDGDAIIRNLDKADVKDKNVKVDIGDTEYEVRIGFPMTKSMAAFLTDYGRTHKSQSTEGGKIDAVTLLSYIDMFLKEIWVRKGGEDVTHINLEDLVVPPDTIDVDENGNQILNDVTGDPQTVDIGECYQDVVAVLEALPSTLLQSASDNDVYTKVSKLLINVVNNALPECICPKCGHNLGKSFGFNDFFSLG